MTGRWRSMLLCVFVVGGTLPWSVPAVADPGEPEAAAVVAFDVAATVDHAAASPHRQRWDGRLHATGIAASGRPSELSFEIGLGDDACTLLVSWGGSDGAMSVPAGVCISDARATAGQVESWIHGSAPGADPRLRVDLVSDEAGGARNAHDVRAELFLRSCSSPAGALRSYASLLIPAGGLVVRQWDDPAPVLEVGDAALSEVRPQAWEEVRDRCGNTGLPEAPPPDADLDLQATVAPTPASSGFAGQLSGLAHDVLSLTVGRGLPRPDAARLTRRLDAAKSALQLAEPDDTQKALISFTNEVRRLELQGRIDAGATKGLAGRAAFVVERIRAAVATPRLPSTAWPCAEREECRYGTLHVDASFPAKLRVRDGTAAAPFASIAEAVAHARSLGLCGVELILHGPDVYDEDVSVDMPMRIVGEGWPRIAGSVVNRSGVDLEVSRTTIESSTGPAGIAVDHRCARTDLDSVTVIGAAHNGIRQHGGSLRASFVRVEDTAVAGDAATEGYGMLLSGGVQAALTWTVVSDNAGGGIRVADAGTRVRSAVSAVFGNGSVPAETIHECGQGGGVRVENGATFDATFLTAENNRQSGVLFTGSFGRLESMRVSRTAGVHAGDGPCGGVNVALDEGAAVDALSFSSSDAVTGVVNSASELSVSHGTISRNTIGAALLPEDEAAACRMVDEFVLRVLFRDNRINLEASVFCVREPSPVPV